MKHSHLAFVLSCFALSASPIFAENLWDIVEEAQNTIVRKYPSEDSIARKYALKELEAIVTGDMSEAQRIEAIRKRYLDPSSSSDLQIPAVKSDPDEETPAVETEADEENSAVETEADAETPAVETDTDEETPAVETEADAGDSKTEAETSAGESETEEDNPADESELEEEASSDESDFDEDEMVLLQERAEQGDAEAQYDLGNCYFNGDGVAQDYAEAADLYKRVDQLLPF